MKITLKQAFQELPMNKKDFAEYADISEALLHKLISGNYKSSPSKKTKAKIRTVFQKIGNELKNIELIY